MDVLGEIEKLRDQIAVIDSETEKHWKMLRSMPSLSIRDMERALICEALARAPDYIAAARLCGLDRRTFRYKAINYGLEVLRPKRGRRAKWQT